jgi:NADH-quinone oxidoreductase subunit E
VQGGGKIVEAITGYLGLKDGKMTSDDMMFTLEPVACLGACGMAPVMMVNEDALRPADPG